MMKGKQIINTPMSIPDTDFSAFAGFSGESPNSSYSSKKATWILHSGASSYICSDEREFNELVLVKGAHEIILPDGLIKKVNQIGKITVNNKLRVENVLYMPDFKYNLLSIGQLARQLKIKVGFCSDYCYL